MIQLPTHGPITASKISNLRHQNVGRGMSPYAPARAHAHTYAPTPTHANATAPHLQYCEAGSPNVIDKMTIPWRWSPFMDDLVKSTPRL
ncbi:hypothetical protein O181_059425 [Austropuccinia psidii MF-1]|uniref:Uncharacterized protein n=1 Tax=Austropuccinia psidii MF-1 TaxID=1389203 RepID=A0A9Q3EIF4_9BASI|nr:hypothetical protein [Austropuccinia psidii MF-1]